MVLVAHSAGTIITVHWAARHRCDNIKGALLAAPVDFETPLPSGSPTMDELRAGLAAGAEGAALVHSSENYRPEETPATASEPVIGLLPCPRSALWVEGCRDLILPGVSRFEPRSGRLRPRLPHQRDRHAPETNYIGGNLELLVVDPVRRR
jgi:pimeloyl-ACP methyl ester carboxylesterase